jgi:hypothetical protein
MDRMSSSLDVGMLVPILLPCVPPPQDTRVVHSAHPTSEHFTALPQVGAGGKAQTSARIEEDHTRGTSDHIFWFWESVFSAAESAFCPKKHAEAMALPQARKVREAEVNEFTSHVQNGTFGPALGPGAFAPGPPLKAVWVYSQSKKDPGAFKARLVMQGFLMQQGLHFNDVHAPYQLSPLSGCLWWELPFRGGPCITGMSKQLSLQPPWTARLT